MNEMEERIAKSLYEDGGGVDWNTATMTSRVIHRREARIALEAMREPTDEMIDAAYVHGAKGWELYGEAKSIWRYMIDAALT